MAGVWTENIDVVIFENYHPGGHGKQIGAIIGALLGMIIVIIVFGVIVDQCVRRRRDSAPYRRMPDSTTSERVPSVAGGAAQSSAINTGIPGDYGTTANPATSQPEV